MDSNPPPPGGYNPPPPTGSDPPPPQIITTADEEGEETLVVSSSSHHNGFDPGAAATLPMHQQQQQQVHITQNPAVQQQQQQYQQPPPQQQQHYNYNPRHSISYQIVPTGPTAGPGGGEGELGPRGAKWGTGNVVDTEVRKRLFFRQYYIAHRLFQRVMQPRTFFISGYQCSKTCTAYIE